MYRPSTANFIEISCLKDKKQVAAALKVYDAPSCETDLRELEVFEAI